jgi:spore germination protein KC
LKKHLLLFIQSPKKAARLFGVIICISTVMLLSGCWSSKEPKELDIIDSVLYDKEPDGTYMVIGEIMNPQGLGGAGILGGASGNKSSFITTMGFGSSIREAISKQTQKEMIDFGGHNKARFLTERLAQDGIAPLLDMITRDRLTDEKPFLVVVKVDDPKNVYNCMIGRSSMVGDYIEDLSRHQPKDKATGVFVSTLEFIRDYYTEGKEPVTGLAIVEKSSDKPSGNTELNTESGGLNSPVNYVMKYEGLAAFKDDRLVGLMDAKEAESYNFIVNKA